MQRENPRVKRGGGKYLVRQEDQGCSTHLFLAAYKMCVSRNKQHSSRDKPLGPPRPLGLPTLSALSPPTRACSSVFVCVCLDVCVCVPVYVGAGGPCTAALAGGSRKDSCAFERFRKTYGPERAEGPQACQSRPSCLE